MRQETRLWLTPGHHLAVQMYICVLIVSKFRETEQESKGVKMLIETYNKFLLLYPRGCC